MLAGRIVAILFTLVVIGLVASMGLFITMAAIHLGQC